MYKVGSDIRVGIEIRGEHLIHYLREMSAEEYLNLTRQEASHSDPADTKGQAELYIGHYDGRILRVEGYVVGENDEDLMLAHPGDWRSLIPGDHKIRVLHTLMYGHLLKKKSEPSS